jgi:hypothetical protein
VNLALLIISLLSGIVGGIKGVPSTITSTIQGIQTALNAYIADGGNTSGGISEQTVLAAIAGVIAALKAETSVPASTLQLISGLEDALAAALAEDKVASTQVAPGTLAPIAPLP